MIIYGLLKSQDAFFMVMNHHIYTRELTPAGLMRAVAKNGLKRCTGPKPAG